MSEALRGAGFAPAGPADATRPVAATRVLFAPGRELDAATVNDVVRARPENVVPATVDDPNWADVRRRPRRAGRARTGRHVTE